MRLVTLGLSLIAAAACRPQPMSDLDTDSGIIGESYDALTDKFANLGQGRSDIKMIDYGRSVDGLPLRMLRIGAPATEGQARRPAIMITEATHGNEYLDVGYEITRAIAEGKSGYERFFAAGGVALIVPVVNPDGYEYHRTLTAGRRAQDGGFDGGNSWGRANKNRKDLNRDYSVKGANHTGFTQPETKALADAVKAEMAAGYDLKTSMDYHCCVGSGALLFPVMYTSQQTLPATDLAKVRRFAGFMQNEMPQVRAGHGPTLIGYPARGTSNDYLYEQYGSASFVYEGRGNERTRVASHVRGWAAIAAEASQGYDVIEEPGTASEPQRDGTIKVMISGESPTATTPLRIAIAAESGRTARLCRGTFATCMAGQGRIEIEFAAPSQRPGAVVFAPPADHAGLVMAAGEAFTVLLDGGADLRGAAFQLQAN